MDITMINDEQHLYKGIVLRFFGYMITLIIDITMLISNFIKLLSFLSMNMITWTSP